MIALRSRVVAKAVDITFTPENLKYVMNKYANDL